MFKMDLICLMAIKKKKEKIQQRDFVKLFKKKKKLNKNSVNTKTDGFGMSYQPIGSV